MVGLQLVRAGTSVGANYRAACRARSRKEFVAKMGIVEEEADECEFWLGLRPRPDSLGARPNVNTRGEVVGELRVNGGLEQ